VLGFSACQYKNHVQFELKTQSVGEVGFGIVGAPEETSNYDMPRTAV
jgi:hypothetical protein